MTQIRKEVTRFESSLPNVAFMHGVAKNLGLLASRNTEERGASAGSPYTGIDMYGIISADRVACGSPPLSADVYDPVPGLSAELARQQLLQQGRLLD